MTKDEEVELLSRIVPAIMVGGDWQSLLNGIEMQTTEWLLFGMKIERLSIKLEKDIAKNAITRVENFPI